MRQRLAVERRTSLAIARIAAACVVIGACGLMARAQQPSPTPPPNTDLYLASLTTKDGRAQVADVRRITNRPGYDNQPAFTPDGRSILFTSIHEGSAADIYRYDIATGAVAQLTRTTEAEYSATLRPGQSGFSVVRVEADGVQRLWQFDASGANPTLLLRDIKPVGYHAWADANTVALFVLGDPPTLQMADARTGVARVLEQRVGRSLHRVPGTEAISFVHKLSDSDWRIVRIDVTSGVRTPLGQTLAGVEDYAWTPEGDIVAGLGSKIYLFRSRQPISERPALSPRFVYRGGLAWEEIVDAAAAGVRSITRIAVSAAGDRIAFVGEN